MVSLAGAQTIWLLELDVFVNGAGESTLYFTDAIGYTTRPTDTPANVAFLPFLFDPGEMNRSLFGQGTTSGRITIGIGDLILGNEEGRLDAMKDHGYGRQLRLKSITAIDPRAIPYGQAITRFIGVVDHIVANAGGITLVIRDELKRLDKPFQESSFPGTSTGPAGIEGDEALEAAPKPSCWGAGLRNVPLTLVNSSRECFAWNFGRDGDPRRTDRITALRNGGAPYALSGVDHADRTVLFGASPASGTADTSLAESLLRTSGSVSAGLTVDIDVEPEVTNLALHSAGFGAAVWSKARATISADAALAPDGLNTAGKLVEDSSVAATHGIAQEVAITPGAAMAGSVYLLAGERTRARLSIAGASGSAHTDADLAAGTVSAGVASGAYGGAMAGIEPVGAGWYRVSILATIAADSAISLRIELGDGAGATRYAGDGASGAFIWGAMLIAGAAVRPYIPTEGGAVTRRPGATAARVAEAMLKEHGLAIRPASLLELDRQAPYAVGIYLSGDETILQAVSRALASVGAYLIDDELSGIWAYRAGRFEAPGGTAVKDFGAWEPIDDSAAAPELLATDDQGRGVPAWQSTLYYLPNQEVQNKDALTGLSLAGHERWSREALSVDSGGDPAVLAKHPNAPRVEHRTYLSNRADAEAELARRAAFDRAVKRRLRLPVHVDRALRDDLPGRQVNLGNHVRFNWGRYGVDGTRPLVVIGVSEERDQKLVFFDVINADHW